MFVICFDFCLVSLSYKWKFQKYLFCQKSIKVFLLWNKLCLVHRCLWPDAKVPEKLFKFLTFVNCYMLQKLLYINNLMTMMFHGKSSLLKCNIWKSCDLKGKQYFIKTFSNCNCICVCILRLRNERLFMLY